MAITYNSQGAGASTETTLAALSPLCPATVAAGDILIGHVYWEGILDAPETPANWTLLSGPHVIQTTVARHWLFGKIADGTEDGAAVAFGAPASVNQRAARIYSFAGRTAGTITELVTGFAATSHATDPQMPTVTTTLAGALAVAVIGQNDNNAFASPTGESGGNWVEAVAEYTVALTPGLSIGIVTCTPTADPGTVTGGSDNTGNDPCGVLGFQIMQSANQTVSAGVGALDMAGFAPTITTSSNQIASAGAGALDLTGLAPTVTASDHQTVLPGVGALDMIGFAPTVTAGSGTAVNAGLGALDMTGFAPVVSVSDNQIVSAGLGALDMTGLAPTVTASDHQTVSAGLGSLDMTGFSPNATASDHQTVLAGLGSLDLAGFAPMAVIGNVVYVDVGSLDMAGFAAVVTASNNQIVSAGLGALDLTGLSPTVTASDHQTVSAGLGSLDMIGFAPIVTASSGVTAEPGVGALDMTGFAPTISVSGGQSGPPVGSFAMMGVGR